MNPRMKEIGAHCLLVQEKCQTSETTQAIIEWTCID